MRCRPVAASYALHAHPLHAAQAGIAKAGPYAYTRNPFYVLLVFVQMPMLGLLFDSAWLIFSAGAMFIWLSSVVIPGEEKFLQLNFGKEYEAYMAATPRWLFSE